MKHVFLVRHGQASAGTDNYDRLSKLGIKQAELLNDYWQQSGFQISAAFSGSLERQQHTADLALAGMNTKPTVNTIEGLNEYDHTVIDRLYGEGMTSDSGMNLEFDQYLSIMQRWQNADAASSEDTNKNESVHVQQSGHEESWEAFAQRGWQSVQTAVNTTDETSIVLFTSGGVIATILKQVMGLAFEPTMHIIWQTRNASVTQLLVDDKGASNRANCLVDYNAIPHLQMHNDKSLITQI